ncbi:MAG TPA: winged helix-turn-helix domain-containing protein [Steroidobacteraceae bacterium]|jgi:TolB-like protein/DNA-binding winged helix-turn-helix (wHTH) protein/Flp pilus assembly protein TadD
MRYRFGDCELDMERFELRRAGRRETLEPLVLELLAYLIANRDRIVTRREINEHVWRGRVVTDAAVNSCIKAARAHIGDDGKAQILIRTVHRKGYRFIGDVAEQSASLVRAAPGDVEPIVAAGDHLDGLELTLPSQPSIAVLPFRFADEEHAHGVLADGLTHEVITRIARARWLFVISRGSAFKFRAGPYDPRDVGRALGVRYVVQGEVRAIGEQISVHAMLADAITGQERWAEHLRRPLRDILTVQGELAELIVGSVESEVEHAERQRAAVIAPANLDSWSAYYRGCWHMYRFTATDYVLAEQYFRRSIDLDPRSPRAYAGLSFIHWQRAFLELAPDRAAEERSAIAFAEEALMLDPRDPLGHWALGRAYLLSQDLGQAVDELETAVQLNPSSAVGQYSLAYALMQTGASRRSNEIVDKARRLSPYDAMTFAMYAVRAQNLAVLGRYADAATFATRAARQPNAHYQVLAIAAYCNMLAENLDAARSFYQELRSVRPRYAIADFFRAFRHQPRENAALIAGAFRQLERFPIGRSRD